MLHVTVELLHGGSFSNRRTLATMEIGNVSDLSDVSDYDISMVEGANPLTGQPARLCSFRVIGHDRRQTVWALVAAALTAMAEAECKDL